MSGLLVRKAMKRRARTSPVGSTKTGEAAWIPINDELAEWIAWRRQQRGRTWDGSVLFVNPRGLPAEERGRELRWTHDALRTTWLRACAEVGVDVGLYEGTKHSSATAWRSGGMSLEHVRRMLRHRDARSTGAL